MGLKDIFNASKIKSENENLKSLLTPEMQDVNTLLQKIDTLRKELDGLEKTLNKKNTEISALDKSIAEKENNSSGWMTKS